MSVLKNFCEGVQGRMKSVGFDWQTLIDTFLPVVIEMISNCFNKASDLESFARGKRGPLQLAGLRNKCRRCVQEQGVRGVFAVARATNALQDAVLAELDEQAGKMHGSVYQDAIDEAMSV
jgi:hypothetical protein